MTDNNHPITPPPELVKLWMSEDAPWDSDSFGVLTARPSQLRHIATQAARWGADQELEACCVWLEDFNCSKRFTAELRAARRALEKPSLKDQGLKALDSFEGFTGSLEEVDIIRRALESLPD